MAQAIEWYDIKDWFRLFQLQEDWRTLMKRYVDKIHVYGDASRILDGLKGRFPMVLTSNAGREFIEVELGATGLVRYFDRIFSATSDFGEVKKTADFYQRICHILEVFGPKRSSTSVTIMTLITVCPGSRHSGLLSGSDRPTNRGFHSLRSPAA